MFRYLVYAAVLAPIACHAGQKIENSLTAPKAKKVINRKHTARKVNPDPNSLRQKAERDGKRHESEMRFNQFLMMQQARNRGYQSQQHSNQKQNTPAQ